MSAFTLETIEFLEHVNINFVIGETIILDNWLINTVGLGRLGDVFVSDYKELSGMMYHHDTDDLAVEYNTFRQCMRALGQIKCYMETVTQDFALADIPTSAALLKVETTSYKKCATSMKFTVQIPNMEDMSDQTWPDHKTTMLILLEGYGLSALIQTTAEERYTTYDKVFGAALRVALQDSDVSFITRDSNSSFSRMYNKLVAWYESAQCKTNRVKATQQLLNERKVDNLAEVPAYVNDMVNGFCTLADLGTPQDEAQKVSGLKDGIELLQVKTPMESLPTGTTLATALEKIRAVLPCDVETLTNGTIRRFGENPETEKTRYNNAKRTSSYGGESKPANKKKRKTPFVAPKAYVKLSVEEQQAIRDDKPTPKLLARIKLVEAEVAGSNKEAAGKPGKKPNKEDKKWKDGNKPKKPANKDKANKQAKKETKSAFAKPKIAKSKQNAVKFKKPSNKSKKGKDSIRRMADRARKAPKDGRLVNDDGSIDDSD
eukprot:scaffold258787_cov98-Attheya_sp.AAC.1